MLQVRMRKLLIPVLGGFFILAVNHGTWGESNRMDRKLKDKITEIINYGSLAPSTHNAQMWKIKIIADNKIRVLVDDQHVLPQVDPENRETFISLGAFIENMAESAPCLGLRPEVNITAQNPSDSEVAELTFAPQNPLPKSEPLENIKNRHTIRNPYLHQALREADLKWFRTTFGSDLHYFAFSTQEGHYIKEAIIQATRQQTANDKKQKELAGLFRFSKKEAEKARDGLTPAAMGLSGITKWFVSTFFTHKTVMSKSFRNQSVAAVKRQAENCSGFIVLTSDDHSVASLITSGRSLEKFLILATGKKLAVHPMSAPLEESPWKDELAQKLRLSRRPQMILRVGYVKDFGHPVSMRRIVPIIYEQ